MKRLLQAAVAAGVLCCVNSAGAAPVERTIKLSPDQISVVEDGIRETLKDPDSAKFGSMIAGVSGPLIMVCGFANAKNSFGGYVGMKPFDGALERGADVAIMDGDGFDGGFAVERRRNHLARDARRR